MVAIRPTVPQADDTFPTRDVNFFVIKTPPIIIAKVANPFNGDLFSGIDGVWVQLVKWVQEVFPR